MNFGRRICCEPEIKSGMWTHLDIDGESSRKDVGDNNQKKNFNLCGGRPHPGLEREADAKVPLDAEEFPFIAVFAKC